MLTISSRSWPPEEAAAPSSPADNTTIQRKKRRPAGTPDPDAEVVSLSPRTLLESDRYVCEICNQGFQRDQNLQMHRRRHKVPWKLMKKKESSPAGSATALAVKKRVFVCPEPSCLHHDPCHALGDLVGIKKHFRRKHSAHRQWACGRCTKAYAVHSDYKAHLKTCGTRGHSCDCGRVFSRVESFIQHQDSCNASRAQPEQLAPHQPPSASRIASSPSSSSDTIPGAPQLLQYKTIELQLLPPSFRINHTNADDGANADPADPTELQLSVAPTPRPGLQCSRDDLRAAEIEKAAAEEARGKARQQVQMAEQELSAARRIRKQAQVELEKACALRAASASQINSILLQITCADCRQRLLPMAVPALPSAVMFREHAAANIRET